MHAGTDREVGDGVLRLSPEMRLARIARATASSAGAIADLPIERVADLRLLVDEVFAVLAFAGEGPVELRVTPRLRRVDLEMSAAPRDARGWGAADTRLVRALADVTTHDAHFVDADGRLVFRGSFTSQLDRPGHGGSAPSLG